MIRLKRQMLDFGLVGVINTLIDLVIFNILSLVLGIPKISSNIVSTTVAMLFSFYANKRIVFDSVGGSKRREVALFFIVTLTGLYVIQSAIIYLLAVASHVPGDVFYGIVELIRLDGVFSREFVVANAAKLIATAVTMCWNYILYKKYVFVSTLANQVHDDD